MYDFDEYLLAYYIHPDYKGFGVKMHQYQGVQSTAAANVIFHDDHIPTIV
ncbi:hypothetical protein RhiirA5_414297 [Rhizophagus irregularis]|uniref:Uncharacterized protein n=1 Tax=Rhizophagus irregularis TaxID=588596 RepID=A0A2N0PUG4_9GLOM|nr:hypothetical protein RhiirA5_414297 [Rhizophagus irregularis]